MQERYVKNLNPRDPGSSRAQEFARHADTRHVRYAIDPGFGLDAANINRDVQRIAPPPGARSRQTNPVFAEFTGEISAPLLTLHETGDFRAPFRLEQDYRRRVQAAGRGHLLVQRRALARTLRLRQRGTRTRMPTWWRGSSGAWHPRARRCLRRREEARSALYPDTACKGSGTSAAEP
jgi:hypothetical protein